MSDSSETKLQHVISDNFEVSVTSSGKDHLLHALELAFSVHPQGATHWNIAENGFYLFGISPQAPSIPTNAIAFPNNVDAQLACEHIWQWLRSLDYDTFKALAGPKPDINGSVERDGFTLTANSQNWREVAKVSPAWRILHV